MTTDNAMDYLDAGASHVIVTSFVFREGRLEEDRLRALVGHHRFGDNSVSQGAIPGLAGPCHGHFL